MPTYDATEAHNHIKPDMLQGFRDALTNADRDGKEVVSVIVLNGVPVVYNILDKS